MLKDREFQARELAGEIDILRLDNGETCEIYMPENPRLRTPFENEYCEFTPVGWARFDGLWYPLGYKVVTEKKQSLGLRGNTNILTFPIGGWVCEENELKPSDADDGGIWAALRQGSIKKYQEHCWETWGMNVSGYLTALYNPIFCNDFRVKSEGVMMLKKIKQ